MAAEKQRSWSSFPDDILPIIFKNLTDVADILKCAAVSRSWRSIIRALCHQQQLKPILLTPFLLLTHGMFSMAEEMDHKNSCFLFNTLTRKIHKLYLPQLEGINSFSGSSYGWLLTIPFDDTQNTHLLNPFTRAQIDLPPQGRWGSGRVGFRVITSANPLDPNCVFLGSENVFFLQSLKWTGKLVICRPGELSWRKVENFEGACEDTIFYQGNFYAINDAYDMFRISVSPLDVVATKLSVTWPAKGSACCKYLVEMNGDLLLVRRFTTYGGENPIDYTTYFLSKRITNFFHVCKLDWQRNRWIEEQNIGNNAILLGKHSSAVVDSTTTKLKENCIYFINDSTDGKDAGVYDMATWRIEWIYRHSPISKTYVNWLKV